MTPQIDPEDLLVRRAVRAAGVDLPGKELLHLATRLISLTHRFSGEPRAVIVMRAMREISDGAVGLVASEPDLRMRPIPVGAATFTDAAEVLVRDFSFVVLEYSSLA